MAEYINIRGQSIEVVASDPANPTLGQIWYNSTSNTLKGLGFGAASWATGGVLPTATSSLGGAGTQTAALAFGGDIGPLYTTATEEYNGTSWSPGGSMATGRFGLAGCGTQTAALAFGRIYRIYNRCNRRIYDGTTWSPGGSLGTARYSLGAAGTQTAGLAFGGVDTVRTGATEEYDGSTWTSSNPLNTARNALAGAGIQTAALAFGGQNPPTSFFCYRIIRWNKLDISKFYEYSKRIFRRMWNSNSSFSFWWYCTTYYRSNRRI
jgi:hypothetical protein